MQYHRCGKVTGNGDILDTEFTDDPSDEQMFLDVLCLTVVSAVSYKLHKCVAEFSAKLKQTK